ncbi:hypothetical protein PPL_03875 [Heterostelium album PN500]|uniref:Uncharacterized protein n=1 Tax=Heterostelium pallidum (strain ATCC 26659 / Pp 5 / PN500) TaxID=670386 RepID=D3B5D8_HETP5|nr:hypothetical protein PPL_03875 [Heterostelium album PN500]EFA83086.1 hypothetical protein PPL_03875 [Heterostelium album PN500]|eukprot:XP_020435203.1 hypothetical protein PPL_03875 [Heterostelium album PN500]
MVSHIYLNNNLKMIISHLPRYRYEVGYLKWRCHHATIITVNIILTNQIDSIPTEYQAKKNDSTAYSSLGFNNNHPDNTSVTT